ncbi:MAG: TonB-dependent receptor [Pseudomonadota bacterium]
MKRIVESVVIAIAALAGIAQASGLEAGEHEHEHEHGREREREAGARDRDNGEVRGEIVAPPATIHSTRLSSATAEGDSRLDESTDGDDEDVASARSAETALENPAFVTVVSIEDRPSETTPLAETLAETVGVSVRSLGGLGSYSAVSIRGASSGQTEILVDGVPLSRIAFAAADIGSLDLSAFDRVEIYRGGVPALYGGAALGGAVSFVTALGPFPRGRHNLLSFGGGSFGARRLRLARRDQLASGRLRTALLMSYAGARGDYPFFCDNGTSLNLTDDRTERRKGNDYDQADASARLRWRGEDGRLLEGGQRLMWREQGVPGLGSIQAEHTSLGTIRSLTDLTFTDVGLFGQPDLDTSVRGYFLFERQSFVDPAGEVGLGIQDSRYQTAAAGGAVRFAHSLGRHQLASAAVDWRAEWFSQRDLIVSDRIGRGRRFGVALAVDDEIAVGPRDELLVVPAGRVDVMDTSADELTDPLLDSGQNASRTDWYLSPRTSLRWRIARAITVKVNAGRYFRAPTVVELFGDRGFIVGNPTLQPETGVTGDIGLALALPGRRRWLDRFFVEAALFASRPRNLIALLPNAGRVARAQNIADARISGSELAFSARLFRTISVTGNYSFLDSAQRSQIISYDGKQVPGRPRHEAYLRVDIARRLRWWSRSRELGAFADVTVVSDSYLDSANTSKLPTRKIVGGGVRLSPWPGLVATVEAKNLLDERVEDIPLAREVEPGLKSVPRAVSDILGYPLPGRAVYAGCEWVF